MVLGLGKSNSMALQRPLAITAHGGKQKGKWTLAKLESNQIPSEGVELLG